MAKRSGATIHIDVGRLQQRDPNYGLRVNCYVCATPHAGSGLARIRDSQSISHIHVPLCEACLADKDIDQRVLQKYWNAPDLKVREGGMWDPAWDKPQ
jgi:hypothetical protein